mmetsp:Transcript_19323/g.54617  ORF Transcript_19323/g.54617 Transcript_19323/m.54617 type:complete len:263 (+) Transcript_19323:62-850(+)
MTAVPPLSSLAARRIASNDLHAQVGSCRDRFLREAAERRQLDSGRVGHVATQTDAASGAGGWHSGDQCAPPESGGWPGAARRPGAAPAWSRADEEAQAEAVQAIRLLSHRGPGLEPRVAGLEEELLGVYAQLRDESALRVAAQEQVRCLEYELDGKEACLQAMASAFEQCNSELQQARSQLSASQAKVAEPAPSTTDREPHIKLIEAKVQAQEFQLQLKEQHISRLMSVLRHHHSFHGEADSTTCGSEDAMATSTATGATGP